MKAQNISQKAYDLRCRLVDRRSEWKRACLVLNDDRAAFLTEAGLQKLLVGASDIFPALKEPARDADTPTALAFFLLQGWIEDPVEIFISPGGTVFFTATERFKASTDAFDPDLSDMWVMAALIGPLDIGFSPAPGRA